MVLGRLVQISSSSSSSSSSFLLIVKGAVATDSRAETLNFNFPFWKEEPMHECGRASLMGFCVGVKLKRLLERKTKRKQNARDEKWQGLLCAAWRENFFDRMNTILLIQVRSIISLPLFLPFRLVFLFLFVGYRSRKQIWIGVGIG